MLITLARKPLAGTVVTNVPVHGTGAINVDQCRIATDWTKESSVRLGHTSKGTKSEGATGWGANQMHAEPHSAGRWPANLIVLTAPEVMTGFPFVSSGKPSGVRNCDFGFSGGVSKGLLTGFGDSGSAARFFKQVTPDVG